MLSVILLKLIDDLHIEGVDTFAEVQLDLSPSSNRPSLMLRSS